MILRLTVARISAAGLLVLAPAGCASAPRSPTTSTPPGAGAATARAVKGDIISVLTVDGVVSASPEFVVWSVANTSITPAPKIRKDRPVKAGQQFGTQGKRKLIVPVAGFFDA